jgi:exodeoxyribonuclease V alpha subunit
MNQTEELIGIVDHIIFQNTENGFSVVVLQINKKEQTTVTGLLPTIHPGEQVTLQGSWTHHPKFGKQFEAQSCSHQLPTTVIGLKKYLGSGLIKGIGPVYATKLVNAFGANVLTVIDKEPHRLAFVDGIGHKRIEKIIAAWQDQKEIANLMVFLQEKGISPAFATKIYKRYQNSAIAIISENPYQLIDDIWGVGFKTADQLAQKLGLALESQKRIRAGIIYTISETLQTGHLYIEIRALKKQVIKLLELTDEQEQKIKEALQDLYTSEKIKVITINENHFITLAQYYYSEKGVATKIQRLAHHPMPYNFNINTIYNNLRVTKAGELQLNEDQQRSILACLQNKVTIITGGPGTGKTTLIKKLLTILEKENRRYKLAAPTGRAAKRITEGTGRYAMTIHRLLELNPATMQFKHNEDNALQLDFLIVDEASMIDIFLAQSILKALPLSAHLVLIGDVDQLPSVGAGNVLNDLIASEIIMSVRLTKIFRQAHDSLIIINAHRVNHGEFPLSYLPEAKRDFFFIKEEIPENVPTHLTTLFTKGLTKAGINPHDAIVLVPMNRGIVGTHNLNYVLQGILNPAHTDKQISRTGTIYKIGDRVMQIRNNYDKAVFNGDIGFIQDINFNEHQLFVDFENHIIEYDFSELDELVLAYAISIHKSQGSEYTATIIPIFMNHFILLQRNLIYTAITRAKQLCIVIGQPKALAIAIKNNKGLKRNTFLKEFLTSDLQCR